MQATRPSKPGSSKPNEALSAQKNKEGKGLKGVDMVPKTRRVPRSEAITVPCPEDNYEEVIAEARSKINFADLKIDAMRSKRAITGALIYEIPGEDSRSKADAFAIKLQEVLQNRGDVKVSRPIKMGELRLRDLDDSTKAEDIVLAISEE